VNCYKTNFEESNCRSTSPIRMSSLALAFGAAMLISACSQTGAALTGDEKVTVGQQAAAAKQPDGWVNQELLLQLKEVRAELAAVREEVKALNGEMQKLSVNGGAAAGPPQPAPAQVAKVELAGLPVLGKRGAEVAIVEFSDFECPYCARHHVETFSQIKKNFIDDGKVKYFSRQYPLPFHNGAKGAAVAALCAGKQDKYWQMRDGLFAHKGSLNSAALEATAKEVGLNLKKFSACTTDASMGAQVDSDMVYGDSIGVSGTPKFFIGRVSGNTLVDVSVLDGAQPYGAFVAALNKKLAK